MELRIKGVLKFSAKPRCQRLFKCQFKCHVISYLYFMGSSVSMLDPTISGFHACVNFPRVILCNLPHKMEELAPSGKHRVQIRPNQLIDNPHLTVEAFDVTMIVVLRFKISIDGENMASEASNFHN